MEQGEAGVVIVISDKKDWGQFLSEEIMSLYTDQENHSSKENITLNMYVPNASSGHFIKQVHLDLKAQSNSNSGRGWLHCLTVTVSHTSQANINDKGLGLNDISCFLRVYLTFLGQGLSMAPEFAGLVGWAVQKAPGIFLIPPPQHWDHGLTQLQVPFYMGLETELRSSHLQSQPFRNWELSPDHSYSCWTPSILKCYGGKRAEGLGISLGWTLNTVTNSRWIGTSFINFVEVSQAVGGTDHC